MIRTGLKNFLKGLNYYLTPLGGILLFIAIGLTIAITNIVNGITDMLNTISAAFEGIQFNWPAGTHAIVEDFLALDWAHDFFGSLSTLFSTDFLNKMLGDCVIGAFGRDDISHIVMDALNNCGRVITIQVAIFLVCTIVGIVVGFIVARMQIRHEIAPLGAHPGRFFIRAGIDILVFAINILLVLWLSYIWRSPVVWVVIVGIAILYAVVTLYKAYLIFGWKHVPLKKIVNINEMLWLYATDIIILAIGIAFVALLFYLVNQILALIIGIPLVMITIIVVDLNAESFVRERILKYEAKKNKEQKA